MSGTSETELKNLIRSLNLQDGFLGTFDRHFPGFVNKHKIQTAIINTGTRESGGQHWLAMGWNPKIYTVFMFDPLGWKDRDLIKFYGFYYRNMIERSALNSPDRCVKLIKNSEAVQCTCAGSCGLFAVLFLYCFKMNPFQPFQTSTMQALEGNPPAIKPSNPSELHKNQNIMYNFFLNKSNYFVKNKHILMSNTNIGLIKTHV